MVQKQERKLIETAKIIRSDILRMSYSAQSAHSGGALSCVEILTVLYFDIMKVFPQEPFNQKRDRLIFSKAHDAKALYSVLARRGYFDPEILKSYEADDAVLPGHSTRHVVPGVEVSTGSLGHGLPMAAGMAYAGKIDGKNHKVFAILSDGECDEGSTWEAALFSSHHRLDNLVAVVDYNKLQGVGTIKEVLNLEPFSNKWEAFGWKVVRVNGHSFKDLEKGLKTIHPNKPLIIIADTIKGYGGVEKHMGKVSSQYKPPSKDELDIALSKLE